jgi:hypothetical protein
MAQVDIMVDDFVDALDSYDTERLLILLDQSDILEDHGYIKVTEPNYNGTSVPEQEYIDALYKLGNSYMRITKEEEEIIKSIAKRF